MNEPWPTEQQAIEHSIRVQRERDEWKQRAEQAESENEKLRALLAAVPVEAIRGVMSEDPLGWQLDAVADWLGIEVQP